METDHCSKVRLCGCTSIPLEMTRTALQRLDFSMTFVWCLMKCHWTWQRASLDHPPAWPHPSTLGRHMTTYQDPQLYRKFRLRACFPFGTWPSKDCTWAQEAKPSSSTPAWTTSLKNSKAFRQGWEGTNLEMTVVSENIHMMQSWVKMSEAIYCT